MLRLSPAVLCLALALLTGTAQGNDNDPARFAPKDALIYLGIDDITEYIANVEKTAMFKLMDDDAAGAAKEMTFLSRLLSEVKKGFAKALKTDPDQLKNPFGGNIAVFLHGPDISETPGFVAVMGVKDRAAMQDYYGKVTERFKKAAESYERIDFSGAGIDVFTASGDAAGGMSPADLGFDPNTDPFSLNDEAIAKLVDATFGQWFSEDSLPTNLAVCLTEEHLYLGQTGDQLKDVIRRGRGADSLVGHEDYKFLLRKFKPGGPMRVFINVPKLTEALAKEDPKMAKAFGLDAFGSLVGYQHFGKKGEYETKAEFLQIMRGERSGIAKILSMENQDLTPNKGISADTPMLLSIQMQFGKVFDDIVRITRQVDPAIADEMEAGLGEVETPDGTMNIRKDVIDNLSGPLQFMVITGRPYTPESMRMMLSMGHKDQGAMSRLLEMSRNMLPLPLNDRDFEGHTIYEMPIGGIAVCASSDALLLGSAPAVEARLRGTASDPLSQTKAWRKLTQYLPEKGWLTVYVDARQLFEAGLALASKREQVNNMAMTNPAAVTVLGMAESMTFVPADENVSKARPLGKYLSASMMVITTTPDGLLLTQVQLHPEDR